MGFSLSEQNVPSASIAVVVEDAGGRPQNNNSNNKNTTMSVFAWAGAILINASFVALIVWGSVSNWIVGFVFSALYTVCLLVFAFWLRRRHNRKRNTADQQTTEEHPVDESRTRGGNTLLTSLLFLLAVVALGVSGSYLPINLSRCAKNEEYYYNGPTNDCVLQENSNVSRSVETWWDNTYQEYIWEKASFAYLPDSETTIFRGNQGNKYGLWKVGAGNGAPEPFPDVSNAQQLVAVGDTSAVCFVADIQSEQSLACTDGETIETIKNNELDYLNDLIYSDGLLWVKGESNVCYNDLYSIDPANLTDLTHHTKRLDSNERSETSGYGCSNAKQRLVFVGLLFLSALPAVAASFLLGFLLKVPSMALSGYAGLAWMALCLVLTIRPAFEDIYDFFRWWLPFTSGPWLVLLTLGSMTKRVSKNALAWGISFSSLVYIVSMFMLLRVFSEGDFWRWAVLTVLAIIPLIVVSLATNNPFLMVLAALGLMVEAGRLAFYIADVADTGAGIIVSVFLALSGIALGFLGFLLSKQYSRIQTKVDFWTDKYLGRWKPLPRNEQGSDGNEASNEDSATSLDEAKNSKHLDGVPQQNV